MNDGFIYRALPKVPTEFAQSLYSKLSTAPGISSQRRIFPWLGSLRWSRTGIIILGVLLLVAWSQLRLWVRYVPVGDLWVVEFAQTTADSQPAIPFVPTPLPTHDWNRTLAPEELSFFLYIPSWIPNGFRDIENLHEMTFWDSTVWMWSNESGEKIRLFLEGKAGGMRPYAPQGLWKQIEIDGEPAILIYGRLALTSPQNPRASREWDKSLGLQLYWGAGKYIYGLETYGPYVSEQDLIRMAESAQEFLPWQLTPTP